MSRTSIAFALALFLSSGAFARPHDVSHMALGNALAELEELRAEVDAVKNPIVRHRLEQGLSRIGSDLSSVSADLSSEAANAEDLLGEVAAEPFDAGKLEAIRRIADDHRITVADARGLASLCSFDSTKKSALVALYPAVQNPEDFEAALDVLTFESSREEVRAALSL